MSYLSIGGVGQKSGKRDCRTWNNKNARQPDAKTYPNELNNFTNNWTLLKHDLNVEWCIAGHVATLKRASSAVNWAVTSFNAFQFADCVNPRRHPLRVSIFQSIMHSLIRLIDVAAVGKLIPITVEGWIEGNQSRWIIEEWIWILLFMVLRKHCGRVPSHSRVRRHCRIVRIPVNWIFTTARERERCRGFRFQKIALLLRPRAEWIIWLVLWTSEL